MVRFAVENRTGQTLHFEVPHNRFHLDLSNGKRYIGNWETIKFNDFRSGTRKEFDVLWVGQWSDFQSQLRNPLVGFYIVGVKDFNSRLPEAYWLEEVSH